MEYRTKYQRSLCRDDRPVLHKWATIRYVERGEVVRCERCGMKMLLDNKMPRAEILSYMIRSVLPASDYLFRREYLNAL